MGQAGRCESLCLLLSKYALQLPLRRAQRALHLLVRRRERRRLAQEAYGALQISGREGALAGGEGLRGRLTVGGAQIGR